jgi:hypothetical protein
MVYYGPQGARTLDLYNAIVALSQLSYRPVTLLLAGNDLQFYLIFANRQSQMQIKYHPLKQITGVSRRKLLPIVTYQLVSSTQFPGEFSTGMLRLQPVA